MKHASPIGQIQSHAGLRGVAALLVVAYHLQFDPTRLPVEDWTLFFKRSYLFVDLFFVLSGFIISLTNEQPFVTGIDAGSYRNFIAKRIARLYPLLLFTLALMVAGRFFLVELYHHAGRPGPVFNDPLTLLLAQATLTNAWLPNPTGWNIPSWSISAEMFAYLLFPLLFTLCRRWPSTGRLLLMLLALAFYIPIAAGSQSLDIIGGTAPFRCLAGFATGMLVYQFRDSFAFGDRSLAALQALAICAIVLMLGIKVNDVALIPFFALLVGTTWQDRGPASIVLGSAVPVWLGTISYSIYLNHVGVIELLGIPYGSAERMLRLQPTVSRLVWLVVCFLAVLLLSAATYRWIEVPGRRWIGRHLVRGRLPPITSSAPAP